MAAHPLAIISTALATILVLAIVWVLTVDALSRSISTNVSRELATAVTSIQKAQAEAIQEAMKNYAQRAPSPLISLPAGETGPAQLQELMNANDGQSEALEKYLSENTSLTDNPLQNMLLQRIFNKPSAAAQPAPVNPQP